MNKRILFVFTVLAVFGMVTAAAAHDGSATITYAGVGVDNAQTTTHNETIGNSDPPVFKGYYTVFTQNYTGLDWTDFHFELPSNLDVFFGDAPGDVTSSQSGLTWSLSSYAREIDLFFPSDPVVTGTPDTVWFKVWTDNTEQQNSLFAVTTYPTDTATVPEPGSLLALSVGAVGLAGFFRKRR